MPYSEENLEKINDKFGEVNHVHDQLVSQLLSFQHTLENERAREYLLQGVGRRLETLTRCLHNIFTIFPADRVEKLARDDLADVGINLHAFFINIAGVFDNLGWVFVYENNLLGRPREGKIDKNGVGLFNAKTQKYLKVELKNYLNTDPIKSWYVDYSKNYRDSLAHRIPLYVPPATLNKAQGKAFEDIEADKKKLNFGNLADLTKYDELLEKQMQLGDVSMFFAHSIEEGCRPAFFHAQIIADYFTIEEVIKKFCEHF